MATVNLLGAMRMGASVLGASASIMSVLGILVATSMTVVATASAEDSATALAEQSRSIFGVLPADMATSDRPTTEARVKLGRQLFFDPRLSKNHDISCNSCHQLDNFGVDGQATSPGHRGQRGDRSSPSVYNAALHTAQFWDGRAADVEEQAKGPVLNPIEMAMPSQKAVLTVIQSIPGYRPLFANAFPGESQPITYDNMGIAIGAFERKLVTPGRFDRFMSGDLDALTTQQQEGLRTFIEVGCITCHYGPTVGGLTYQKLGLIKAYESEDPGRFKVTGNESDRSVWKVPSLRNIAKTGPYLHNGSVEQLDDMVAIMGRHQLGMELSPTQVKSIVTFLNALTGEADVAITQEPALLPSGPDTPAPDPS
ncbi:cytochrome-c peroxidase [Myxococcota bacterium]|nr:cytochrome-c peroxidase [Myxococcota bacterium]